ncbi:hypothetical protein C2855_05590 [Aeromonas bestiarum]|uniref:Polysaccharide biosynthesis protein n=1 Tax=Aeromonas bestiarum TaxID=105751 RepID=A0A068FS48_9GAMM|nr:hypothetical protein [Aeromonas bestiarum]AID70972.1 polysaccharide biosynthesis protein [Aeromonas bestiarum]POG24543.1 hypothetical protein C2855_05590 [Aeromonas bestiarum]
MESKKFIAVTIVLYVSSLISYYTQIKIIDIYGLQVKYYFDLYISYLQITITLAIFGLPSAISLMVSRENKIPSNINFFSLICAIVASTVLNLFFLNGSLLIQLLIFIFLYISFVNDLNTGVMSSIGMFEYPRVWLLLGNATLLIIVAMDPIGLLQVKDTLGEVGHALMFIIIPIIPLFLVLNFGKKFKTASIAYEAISLRGVFKYINHIYLFSILSIIMTRVPYINFSEFIDKYSLAQYTLSISLSNFIVIPLNVLTLKLLSSNMEKKPNIFLINLVLIFIVFFSALLLYCFSSNTDILYQLTNISSSDILISTYLVIATVAISSINLSVSLRLQKKIKAFLVLDIVLVIIIFLITLNTIHSFQSLSSYNYMIVSIVFLKILFQNYLLRE